MKNPTEIRTIALERLQEAEILSDNGKPSGAYYLSGYSVELALKAKICERFDVPNLFDEEDRNVNSIVGIGEIRKALKIHNLYALIIYSGLRRKLEDAIAGDRNISKASSLLFGVWNENVRYRPCACVSNLDVRELISLLKQNNGLLEWIERN